MANVERQTDRHAARNPQHLTTAPSRSAEHCEPILLRIDDGVEGWPNNGFVLSGQLRQIANTTLRGSEAFVQLSSRCHAIEGLCPAGQLHTSLSHCV